MFAAKRSRECAQGGDTMPQETRPANTA
uniref:Uncharacterized protein n=1 Tax=Anguilla anguilla TaxID=7936 RepID=A0A0E9SSA9_ANGAN